MCPLASVRPNTSSPSPIGGILGKSGYEMDLSTYMHASSDGGQDGKDLSMADGRARSGDEVLRGAHATL
jgi:hypothetical protein